MLHSHAPPDQISSPHLDSLCLAVSSLRWIYHLTQPQITAHVKWSELIKCISTLMALSPDPQSHLLYVRRHPYRYGMFYFQLINLFFFHTHVFFMPQSVNSAFTYFLMWKLPKCSRSCLKTFRCPNLHKWLHPIQDSSALPTRSTVRERPELNTHTSWLGRVQLPQQQEV